MRRLAFVTLMVLSCVTAASVRSTNVDTLYVNGTIITMAGNQPAYVEAVAVTNSLISFAGKEQQARKACNARTKIVDLQGKTMLPGFIEAHSHFTLTSIMGLFGDLSAPPVGSVSSHAQIVKTMKEWVKNNDQFIQKTGWIVGYNYDELSYEGHLQPDRDLLDQISTQYPIIIVQQSIHMGSVNSKTLQLLGIDDKYVDPPNGVARRKPGTTIPNGVIEESVFFRVFAEMSQHMSYELIARSFVKFEQKYYSHGFTTVTDGRTDNISLISLIRFANEKRLKLDVVAYIDFIAFTQNDSFKNFSNYTSKYNYTNHMRIGGGKLAMDGSVQAFTAWLSKPYYHTPDGKSADYRGYPSFNSTQEVANLMTILRKNDMQINVHANGDAAVQRLIEAVEESRKDYKTTINIPSSEPFNFTNLDDERVVCVHCQVTSPDQTLRMKENNIIPSYFNAHTQFWGDFHKNESLGPERAKRLSVAGEAHNYGMLFTSHLDSPVVPPDAAYIISSLVNRKTASGVTLGEQYIVSTYQALLAITKYAAYQIFEEKTKGSIEVGQVADFVILSENPLNMKSEDLVNIKVLRTIKSNVDLPFAESQSHLKVSHRKHSESLHQYATKHYMMQKDRRKKWSFDQ